MTNTSDFRRYYSSSTSAAIEAFSVERSSAAPKKDTESADLHIRVNENKKARQSAKELKQEQRNALARMIVVLTTAVLAVGMVSAVLTTYVQKNELTRQISSIQSEINMAESDNISLNSQLDALASISQVEDYAVNNLGMVKLQASQIVYIDTSEFIFLHKQATSNIVQVNGNINENN